MIKKLLSNKATLIFIAIVIIIAGIFISIILDRDSKDNPRNDDKEKVAGETEIEIKKEIDEEVDSVDGSGSWEESADNEKPANRQETPAGDKPAEMTDEDQSGETSDGNILEDDKEWGPIF